MLTVAAWYDIFQGGSLRNYVGVKMHGGSEEARRGQRLLVTIGGHAGSSAKIGDVDFGTSAPFEEDDVIISWYEHLFKNVANEFSSPEPVRLFVMGANQWRNETDWPLPRARQLTLFSAFRWQSQFCRRRRNTLLVCTAFGVVGSLCLRPGETGAHGWWPAVL